MDTIARHHNTLIAQYVVSPAAAEIIASAKHLAELVVASDKLLNRHRKKILSEILWLISEANGKYSTRFRSAEVVRLAIEEPNSPTKIQHEHVYPRKRVIEDILRRRDALIQDSRSLGAILDKTVGCVVTHEEHRSLSNSADGWERYNGVEVLDMSTDPPVRLRK
jgi:hypothetical protein